ncbi:formamidopyrimidine-DNA glycosylase [Sanguibacter keddieii DSM 10542]|uniref:DNA-(apurinic or apyrimidinic site) lyase n=1 Tax=Sanguibacter keddieii (strain ATCC 51767 / DSM 10542 / NCFB 3025 / ST-74) TaxID=446469 RepID=D1BJ44_SANKS|nr:DNA-formamidopyrimidine glycosylase family protein [Sanguibacter keddieii]ACZ22238.1 formamidopyrimidine-DNA glycosylase [Sanguibacter keddieii DSM 10542]
MPEGDTVFLTARRLDEALSGTVLTWAELRWPNLDPTALAGTTVLRSRAYGKHVLTTVDSGWTLHTHLRMDGTWRVHRTDPAARLARRPTVRAVLANETWTCVGDRLGMMDLVRTRDEHTLLDHLGPDILAPDFGSSPDGLAAVLRTYQAQGARPVGDCLLDQTLMAGVGTLFAAEGLFDRQVWPWTPAAEVDLVPLLGSIRRNLLRGVARPVDGRVVHVHSRSGSPCHRCGTTIVRGLAGVAPMERPMFYCPVCQPEPPR